MFLDFIAYSLFKNDLCLVEFLDLDLEGLDLLELLFNRLVVLFDDSGSRGSLEIMA